MDLVVSTKFPNAKSSNPLCLDWTSLVFISLGLLDFLFVSVGSWAGLKKWQTAREEWCRKRKSTDPESAQDGQISNRPKAASAIPIDVDGVIDVLFDPRWRGGSVVAGQRAKVSLQPPRFPTNVPLPQMIDVLTDLWEAEGLDV